MKLESGSPTATYKMYVPKDLEIFLSLLSS